MYLWKRPPLNGEMPDVTFTETIGNVRLSEVRGVAMDHKYFYLSDTQAKKIYIWEGIPARDSDPKFALSVERPGRLSSDGEYLVVSPIEGHVVDVYRVAQLATTARPISR